MTRMSVAISGSLVLLTFAWLQIGRWSPGHDDWHLTVADTALPLRSMSLAFLALFLFGGLIGFFAYDRFKRAKTRKEQTASTGWCIAAIAMFALVWPWTLSGPFGTLLQVMANWSDVSNQYFSVAYEIDDARAFTATYDEKWQDAPSRLQAHVATHPPGAVLFYYGARRAIEASPFLQDTFGALAEKLANDTLDNIAVNSNQMRESSFRSAGVRPSTRLPVAAVPAALWCNFLLTLALALTVPAVYIMASAGPNESGLAEARGMVAALLFALAPCVSFFAFTIDILIACGAAWALACTVLYFKNGNPFWILATGALLALTTFLSFGAMAAGVIVGLMVILTSTVPPTKADNSSSQSAPADCQPQAPLPRFQSLGKSLPKSLALCAAGFLAMWTLIVIVFPMRLPAIFHNAMLAHGKATLGIRDYRWWVWLNLAFFLAFLGWPVAVGLVLRFWPASPVDIDLQWPALLRALGWAVVATILALTLSGKVMGEVERLWLFLVPPCCALAASALVQLPARKQSLLLWLSLIGLQVLQTVVLIRALVPLVSPI